MVPPQRYENEQSVEEMKSREPTRSKSHESMRSDRMTQRGVTQGQVDSKSFIVPHHRRSEGAATQQRPGASTSSTSPALHSILACLLVCFAYGQGEAPGYIATIDSASLLDSFPLRLRRRSSLAVRTLGRLQGSRRGYSL